MQENADLNPVGFYLEGKGAPILFVHGYTGSPDEMLPIANALHQKFNHSCLGIKLPGHGTHSDDLKNKTASDWMQATQSIADRWFYTQQPYHLVGLSMGASLCLLLAKRNPKLIESLTLISPAVWPQSLLGKCVLSLLLGLPASLIPNITLQKKKNNFYKQRFAYDTYTLKSLKQCAVIFNKVKNLKLNLEIPGSIYYSKADQTIDPKSALHVQKMFHPDFIKINEIPNAPHVISLSNQKEILLKEISDFYQTLQ